VGDFVPNADLYVELLKSTSPVLSLRLHHFLSFANFPRASQPKEPARRIISTVRFKNESRRAVTRFFKANLCVF
jgi:hypothetical protein